MTRKRIRQALIAARDRAIAAQGTEAHASAFARYMRFAARYQMELAARYYRAAIFASLRSERTGAALEARARHAHAFSRRCANA